MLVPLRIHFDAIRDCTDVAQRKSELRFVVSYGSYARVYLDIEGVAENYLGNISVDSLQIQASALVAALQELRSIREG